MTNEKGRRVVTWERVKEGVALITFDNPPVNAISTKLSGDLLACVEELEKASDIRVVILTSANEKIFLAGADLTEMLQFDDHAIRGRFMELAVCRRENPRAPNAARQPALLMILTASHGWLSAEYRLGWLIRQLDRLIIGFSPTGS